MADPTLADLGALSVREAVALIGRTQNKSVPEGAECSLPVMTLRLARPELLIDADERPADLAYIRLAGEDLRIGSLTTRAELLDSSLISQHFAGIRAAVDANPCAAPGIPGTIGASLCRASTADRLVGALAAVHARVVIRSARGRRTVPVREFCQQQLARTLAARGDLIAEIRIPVRPAVSR